MHALLKKNKNAERYSQNSCQDIQKEFQHFVDPWPLRDADSQVTRCTQEEAERMFAKTPKSNLQSRKKEEKERENKRD
jgi:hypothetical protein